MKRGLFQNRYLTFPYFVWNFVLILILALLAGFLYSGKYMEHIANASRENEITTYNVKTINDIMNQDGDQIYRGSKEMWIGTGSKGTRSYLGIKFTGKRIPSDAELTVAELTFTSSTDQEAPLSIAMYVEDNATPLTFSPNNTPFRRKVLPIKKSQVDTVHWEKDKPYSYDVSTLIKKSYEKNGINGSLVLLIHGQNDTSIKKNIYGSPNSLKSPRLRIQYKIPKK